MKRRRKKRRLRPQVKIILILAGAIILFLVGSLLLPKKEVAPDYSLVDQTEANIPATPYDYTKFNRNTTYLTYEDDNYTSITILDVSTHNKEIDWQQVKAAGIDYAFIRLGYRGYQEGILHVDDTFEYNYKEAKKAGVSLGIYFFSQSISEEEAMDEAFFVIDNLKDKEIDLPVVYDLEDIPGTAARVDNLEHELYTKMALAFCQKIEAAGYQPMIYTNKYWSEVFYDLPLIYNYPIWYAQYSYQPEYYYAFDIWQYSCTSKVPGVSTDCDLSIMFIPK
ncbi:MAG: lysozyme [Erysipelotrichaceae bacterium]|nr:lysozyme [Erysipelotrichaceae bacterium]